MKKMMAGLLSLFLLISIMPTAGAASASPFTDVPEGSYYYDAVFWARDEGVTSGTSETTFSPDNTCTRGQAVTFLWRSLDCPQPASGENPFTDVSADDYFYQPVLWAVEKGVTVGTSETTFSPGATCTSAQVVTFLYRANGEPAAKGESRLAAVYPNEYFTNAVAWAESAGLLQGVGDAFSPDQPSPRADIVTYLYRNAGSPAVSGTSAAQGSAASTTTGALSNILQVSGERVIFSALPENAAEMQEALQEWQSNEKAVAALFIEALAIYAIDPDAGFSMMDVLVGGMSNYDKQMLKSRMEGKEAYLPFSYFTGAVQSNNYEPSEPYTVTVKEQSNSRDETDYIKLFIPSGGADSARPIKLRQEDGRWYVHEYSSILLDIRRPQEQPEEAAILGSATFQFSTLPKNAEEMQAMSQLDFQDPYSVAAFTVAALAAYHSDREGAYAMLDVLNGSTELNNADKSSISSNLFEKDYHMRSYFRGATPQNDYTPSSPYTIDLTENESFRKEEGYIRIDVVSSGSTSVRNIRLRLDKGGSWYLWNYSDLLRSVEAPSADDPWAT